MLGIFTSYAAYAPAIINTGCWEIDCNDYWEEISVVNPRERERLPAPVKSESSTPARLSTLARSELLTPTRFELLTPARFESPTPMMPKLPTLATFE